MPKIKFDNLSFGFFMATNYPLQQKYKPAVISKALTTDLRILFTIILNFFHKYNSIN